MVPPRQDAVGWTAGIAFALVVGSAPGIVMAGARRLAPCLCSLRFIDTGVQVRIGLPVRIAWEKQSDEISLPQFEPDA